MVLPSPHNPLCAFTTLTFCRLHRPFLAGAKLPSRKAASHCSSPSASSAPSSVRHALSQTPYSSHSSDVASRSKAKDTHRAKNATPLWSAESTECLQNRPGSAPEDGHDHLSAASAQATEARPAPTAHALTTSAASSWQNLNSSTASHVSTWAEEHSPRDNESKSEIR